MSKQQIGIAQLSADLIQKLKSSHKFFSYGDGLIEPRINPDTGATSLKAFSQADLEWYVRRIEDLDERTVSLLAKDILHAPELPFRRVRGLVTTPTFRQDFSLITEAGFDPTSGLYYAPDPELQNFKFRTDATKEDAKEALALLKELLTDFPFEKQSSHKLTFLGALLTLFLRSSIPAIVPALCLDGNDRSVGKGLLSTILSLIVFGQECASMSVPSTRSEWGAKLDSILLAGTPFQVIDNIVGDFANDDFASVLTAMRRQIRIKGVSRVVTVPVNTFWVLNGNELQVDSDMAERIIRCRLEHNDARSREQDDFYVQRNYGCSIETLLKRNRAKYLQACLNIVCGWVNSGSPKRLRNLQMAKYGAWESVLGGIFDWIADEGEDGRFLAGHRENAQAVDSEKEETIAFLMQLRLAFPYCGKQPITPSDVAAKVFPSEGRSELRDFVPKCLLNKAGKSFALSLAHWLKSVSTRNWGAVRIKKQYQSHGCRNAYLITIEKVKPENGQDAKAAA